MKVAFICPFNLDRLTGTPIRAKITIKAVSAFSDISVIFSDSDHLTDFSRKALTLLRGDRPDIVHCFTTIAVLPAAVYKLFFDWRVKVVFEIHGWSWFETAGRLNFFKRFVMLFLDVIGFAIANVVIAMSFTQKKFIANFGRRQKVEVIWGPVDFPISYSPRSVGEIFTVGYIGNASFWQGLSVLIGAAKLLEADRSIKFKLAGFKVDDRQLFPLFANVEYVGFIDRPRVPEFIKSCDVMISPRVKGAVSDLQYPQKLSEYLGSGRPVIASVVSDQPQVIGAAECGLLVDPLTPENLVKAIQKIATISAQARGEMGHRAADFAAKNFAEDVFGGKLKTAYSHL